jgi:hypothetical protein
VGRGDGDGDGAIGAMASTGKCEVRLKSKISGCRCTWSWLSPPAELRGQCARWLRLS